MSMDSKKPQGRCTLCAGKFCYPFVGTNDPLPPLTDAPEFCPMRRYPEEVEHASREYARPGIREFARLACIQEKQCYEVTPEGIRTKIPRIEEITQFARKCNYTRLGLAYCIGLKHEARAVSEIMENNGFEVVSIGCKVGRIPKESLGLDGQEKIMGPDVMEPACNPIAQAEVLNVAGVDFIVLLGLCVGHDTLFFKYCQVPCTVLAVKDRVFGHNPLAAIYLSNGPYYGRIKKSHGVTGNGERVVLPKNVRG